jgi:hypothetical protein
LFIEFSSEHKPERLQDFVSPGLFLVTRFSQSFLSQDQDQQTEDTQDIARKFSEALCRSAPSFSKAVLLKQMRPVQNVSFVFLLLHCVPQERMGVYKTGVCRLRQIETPELFDKPKPQQRNNELGWSSCLRQRLLPQLREVRIRPTIA